MGPYLRHMDPKIPQPVQAVRRSGRNVRVIQTIPEMVIEADGKFTYPVKSSVRLLMRS